jgi:hypothetical protein
VTGQDELTPGDLGALFALWPTAMTCPRWRLGGESPSPGLLQHLTSDVEYHQVLRDSIGVAVGLLQIVEVDRVSGFGHLSFLLPEAAGGSILPFLRDALVSLGLRRIYVLAEEDGLRALAPARSGLVRVGQLRGHTMLSRGRYQDRYVFEFDGAARP